VLQPAGLDKSVGIISAAFLKDAADPQWSQDPGMQDYLVFMRKYYPEGDPTEYFNVMGYMWAQALVYVLERCGDNLTRENVMKQAASLNNVSLPTLLPGVTLQTSATDFAPIKQMQLVRFDGKSWVRVANLASAQAPRQTARRVYGHQQSSRWPESVELRFNLRPPERGA